MKQKPDRHLHTIKFEEESFAYRYIINMVICLILPVLSLFIIYSIVNRNYASLAILVLIFSIDIVILVVDRIKIPDKARVRFNGILLKFQVLALGIFLLYGMGIAANWVLLPWTFAFCYLALIINGIRVGATAVAALGIFLLISYLVQPQPPDLDANQLMIRFFPSLLLCVGFISCAEYVRFDYRRKLAEANIDLTASKGKYRTIFEHAVEGFYQSSPDGRFTRVNPALARMLGYDSPGEMISEIRDIRTQYFSDPRDYRTFITLIREKGAVRNFEFTARRKDGSLVWLSSSTRAVFNDQGLIVLYEGSEKDITDRKTAEASLKESESLFRLITRHTSALVFILDADGNYIYASPSHERIGFAPETLLGNSGFIMVMDDDVAPLKNFMENARKANVSHALLDYRIRDNTGEVRFYRGTFDAAFNPDGSLEKIVCIGEDITQLRQAQAEKLTAINMAAETKKLALVGQIAGKLSHDFNNVLGGIMGNAEYALLDCRERGTRKILKLIFEQTVRGKNLTKNLVAFARDQEPKQDYFPIDEKIELVLNLLKKELDGIRVKREYDKPMPDLMADPGMIEHALVNLVQNAIHATSLSEQPEIIIRAFLNGSSLHLEIQDNGCGIPEDALGRIYEPAFTLKGSKDIAGAYKYGIKGTGYGMSNVKKYIEQHRGTIRVTSESGYGTTCTITLPVIEKELTTEEKVIVREEITQSEKSVLVVEDEAVISEVQFRILSQEPCRHRVDVAEDAQAAMYMFDRNSYDFISLDYMLPGDLTGMDVYTHIRGKNKTVPILFVSGNIEFLESIKRLKQQDPCIDHMSKPCPNKEYVDAVNRLLEKSTSHPT